MSKSKGKSNKSNKSNKKTWRIALVGLVFTYLFLRSGPSLLAARSKTVLPENSLIEDKIKAEAIIIKKEYLYKSYGKGKIEILIEEGNKVSKGTKIAELTLLEDDSTLNQDLKEMDNQIETLETIKKDGDIAKNDKDKIENNIEDLLDEIQQSISKEDYENIIFLKDKLAIYEGKQKDVSGQGKLINQSLNSLKDKREQIMEQVSSNRKDYFSQEPGIVSFKIDGYEDLYSFNHKEEYDFSDFQNIDDEQKIVKDKDDVETEDSIFKIIDNFEWYMVINIENMDDLASYEEGDSILIAEDGINDNIDGRIKKIHKEKNKGLILCKFNTDFDKYYDKRHMKIHIVKDSQVGYKIPSKSIIEKDDVKGVYVKDISGIIKFKPIKIIMQEDKTTYIDCGDENNKIEIEGYDQPIKTIATFDEIFSNTTNLKEGMIIN